MKIAVNTRLLQYGKLDGIGWFTYETLKRITKNHPQVEFIFIFDRRPHPALKFPQNVREIVLPPPTRHPVLWYLWFEWLIPTVLKRLKPDLFLSPDGYISLRTKTPQLAVIHDINFIHRPQELPFCIGSYYRHYFPKFAKKATRIVTVSEYSKQDICNTFSVPGEKVDVVFNGAGEIFSPLLPEEIRTWKERHTRNSDYFVYVGSLHPRKNIVGLLKAFDEFKKTDSNGIKLMIVGEPMFKTFEIRTTLKKMIHRNDVVSIGRLNPDDLRLAIGAAQVLLLVSFFEGFGIPVLEAMKCNIPVICSGTTSLPEVAGEAALYIDPFSPQSISQAMTRLVKEKNLRESLIEKGSERSNMFSWDKTSDLLWESIEKAINPS